MNFDLATWEPGPAAKAGTRLLAGALDLTLVPRPLDRVLAHV
jgi:hypothetical protein